MIRARLLKKYNTMKNHQKEGLWRRKYGAEEERRRKTTLAVEMKNEKG